MTTIHINRPSFTWSKRVLHCPTCDRRRRFVVASQEWYDPIATCCACGDAWSGGERMPRPFRPGWRKAAIARARAHWAEAPNAWDGDPIYMHTWRARAGATLHATVVVEHASGVGGRHVLACNHHRLVEYGIPGDVEDDLPDDEPGIRRVTVGEHHDYRTHGPAIGSPTCRHEPCQRLFRNPEDPACP